MRRLYFCRQHNQASILVLCLGVIMILSILGLGLTGLVFQEIRFAKAYQRLTCSLPISRAALKVVFYLRKDDPAPDYDTLNELTRENELSLCGDNSYKYYFADKDVPGDKTEVIDEGALVNLNTVSIDVLKRLPGMDEEQAVKLVNSGLRPFNSPNETLLVEGITKDKFALFKDLVTVHGTGKVNINTARRQVFLALGLDEELIKIILNFRKEHKIVEVKKDDQQPAEQDTDKEPDYGFSSVDKILDDLRDFASLSLSLKQEQDLLSLLPVLDVKSEFLRFNVIPFFGKKEGLHYSIVIHPTTKKILSWNEY